MTMPYLNSKSSTWRRLISQLDDYEGLIRVLAATGRDDLARMALQRAGQLAGGTADGQLAYARMSASLAVSQADRARIAGRFAESFDMLQTAWNASPENADVLSALARLYQTGNMPARAAQTFQLVLARDATDKDALLGLALTAQIAGDCSLSERAQADVLRAFPRDYEVRISLARVEQARGNDGAALKLLKQARELYLGQNGQSAGLIAGGNPFASMDPAAGNNPFRQQAQVQPVNPFALGSGTRVSSVAVGYPGRLDPRGNQYYGENYNARPSNPAGMSQWQQPSEAMAGWGLPRGVKSTEASLRRADMRGRQWRLRPLIRQTR